MLDTHVDLYKCDTMNGTKMFKHMCTTCNSIYMSNHQNAISCKHLMVIISAASKNRGNICTYIAPKK